jgi:hypothetical protein
MKLNRKNVGIGLAVAVLVGAGLLYFLQNRLERTTTYYLTNNLPRHIQLDYEELDISIFRASLELKMIKADFFDPVSLAHRNALVLDELRMVGLNYWDYLVNDHMVWDEVLLRNPHFVYYNANSEEGKIGESEAEPMKTDWLIKELLIENGSFAMVSEGKPRPVLTFKKVQAVVHNCMANNKTTQRKIPLEYENFNVSMEDFYSELGEFERVDIARLGLQDKSLEAEKFSINTRFSKEELSKQLKTERDHTSLEIEKIVVSGPALGYRDSVLHLSADSVLLQRPVAEIYRDKLVADNPEYRPLYSQMLRELPFFLKIPRMGIRGGVLRYAERVKQGSEAGTLTFKNLNADIQNVSNTYEPPVKTTIKASAVFMENSPIELDWNFDINDIEERFTVSGTISDFNAPSINSFLESTMNYRVEGFVHKLYFTSGGNKVQASGDLEMNYRDFDLIVMKEDGSGVNKLLTVIGDILVKENKDNEDPGFRYGQIDAKRDPTKSFFNYLWLNIRSGIKSSVTGDGEKD